MFSSFDFKLQFYRDDLNHPIVSGNKLHKLAPSLALAAAQGHNSVLSFGGPYSNHLHALAWASREKQLISHGIVRGELHQELSPTLKDCEAWGMRLYPMARKLYREIQHALQNDHHGVKDQLLAQVSDLPQDIFVIPEGGSNQMAIDSLARAYRPIFSDPQFQNVSHVICATGTGATVAGLSKAAPDHVQVIGIQAVAEGPATEERIRIWLGKTITNLQIIEGHLGGFAKTPTELLDFIQHFESIYNIPLDPIYNGKVMFTLLALAKQGFFAPSDELLVLHTGGLQGKRA